MTYRAAFFILSVTAAFLCIIQLPVAELLVLVFAEDLADVLEKLILGSFVIWASLILSEKMGISRLGGFTNPSPGNYGLILIPFIYPGIFALTNPSVSSFLPMVLAVHIIRGLCEEVVYRGIILGYLRKHEALSVHAGISITALIFSCSHAVNFIYLDAVSVVCQLLYAFYMGLLFGVLLHFTNNVWLLGICHGILNHLFSAKGSAVNEIVNHGSLFSEEAIRQVLLFAVIFSPVLLIYLWLLKKLKTNSSR